MATAINLNRAQRMAVDPSSEVKFKEIEIDIYSFPLMWAQLRPPVPEELIETALDAVIEVRRIVPKRILIRSINHPSSKTEGVYRPDQDHVTVAYKTASMIPIHEHVTLHAYTRGAVLDRVTDKGQKSDRVLRNDKNQPSSASWPPEIHLKWVGRFKLTVGVPLDYEEDEYELPALPAPQPTTEQRVADQGEDSDSDGPPEQMSSKRPRQE